MANENVTFWGFSTGNEPLNGIIGWIFVHFMSLGWTANTQVGTRSWLQTILDILTYFSNRRNGWETISAHCSGIHHLKT